MQNMGVGEKTNKQTLIFTVEDWRKSLWYGTVPLIRKVGGSGTSFAQERVAQRTPCRTRNPGLAPLLSGNPKTRSRAPEKPGSASFWMKPTVLRHHWQGESKTSQLLQPPRLRPRTSGRQLSPGWPASSMQPREWVDPDKSGPWTAGQLPEIWAIITTVVLSQRLWNTLLWSNKVISNWYIYNEHEQEKGPSLKTRTQKKCTMKKTPN